MPVWITSLSVMIHYSPRHANGQLFCSTTRKRAKNSVILGVAPETCPPASETLNPSQRPIKQAAGVDSISLGVLALLRVVVFVLVRPVVAPQPSAQKQTHSVAVSEGHDPP